MRKFFGCMAVAIAAAALAPTAGAEQRQVAPDGRSVAFSSATSWDAADADTPVDVYSWNRGALAFLSGGPGSSAHGAWPRFISDDGTRVLFTTTDPLLAVDTDTVTDIYESAGGVLSLVTTGPVDTHPNTPIEHFDASEDGTRVFFTATTQLVASDTDSLPDVYRRDSDGTTTLVSTVDTADAHTLVAASRNGDRMVEKTYARMTADDTDSSQDLYEHFAGSVKLVSKATVAESAADQGFSVTHVTPDAKSFVIYTRAQLTAGDQNEDYDLYQFSRGRTTLVTSRSDGVSPECGEIYAPAPIGAPPRQPPCVPYTHGQSDDGSKVLFWSPKPLADKPGPLGLPVKTQVGGLLEKTASGSTRLIDEDAPQLNHAIADDGGRYIVTTTAQRSPADTDEVEDLYMIEDGSATLLSGASPSDQSGDHVFSSSARRVFFSTWDALVPEDTNGTFDLYVNTDAGPRLALTGPAEAPPIEGGGLIGPSASGDRWFFLKTKPLVAEDTDAEADLYVRHLDGTTRLLSP